MVARKPAAGKPAAKRVRPAPAAPINAVRGEVSISLEGVDYPLRPTFAAIGEIEAACGLSLYELAVAAEATKLTLADAGIIISACIRAQAKAEGVTHLAEVRPERIGELIYGEVGGLLMAIRATIAPLLLLALTGAYDALGKRRPQTMVNPTSGHA